MKQEVKERLEKKISEVNEARHVFWEMYRDLRNSFLRDHPKDKYHTDEDWLDLFDTINDLYESPIKEEMRRQLAPPRRSLRSGDKPKSLQRRKATGLYKSQKLCQICQKPLKGRQRKFCSRRCKVVSDSRKYRKHNPDQKSKSNQKYLNECYPPED